MKNKLFMVSLVLISCANMHAMQRQNFMNDDDIERGSVGGSSHSSGTSMDDAELNRLPQPTDLFYRDTTFEQVWKFYDVPHWVRNQSKTLQQNWIKDARKKSIQRAIPNNDAFRAAERCCKDAQAFCMAGLMGCFVVSLFFQPNNQIEFTLIKE